MMSQPQFDPARGLLISSIDARAFREYLRNVQRLIDYNNRRVLLGYRPVTMPPGLNYQQWRNAYLNQTGQYSRRFEVESFSS